MTWGSSVKRINSADNRRAGAQLGAFYRKERIFDPYDETRWPYDPEYVVNRFTKDTTGRVNPVQVTELKHDQRFYIMFR